MSERQSLNGVEIGKLLKVMTDPRDRAIVILGLRHGFRSSEIADLKLSDLDLRNKLVRIRRGKGSETNIHALTDVAPYFELRTLQAALDARPQSSDEFVFISRNQGRLHRSQIFRIFQGAAQDAGLPRTKQHYHCCKHSAAVSMLKHGASMPEVQKRFGWKSLATVGRYLAVSDETADIAADKAEKQFAQSCAAQSRHKLS